LPGVDGKLRSGRETGGLPKDCAPARRERAGSGVRAATSRVLAQCRGLALEEE
jgi:hypothetical protein